MVRRPDSEIETREVLGWTGVHLFHFPISSCSQKTRIVLNLKGVDWTPHLVNHVENENWQAFYLGINPRGLVPTLVLDGAVHIESNDILEVLEERFPDPILFPIDRRAEIRARLAEEDALHIDLRMLSFRFVYGRPGSPKPAEILDTFRNLGPGTIDGRTDTKKAVEIEFYDRLAADGLTDDACRTSAAKFRSTFEDWDERLADTPYLLGTDLTAIDIAWFVYAYRLTAAGYPLARLHPRLGRWFAGLCDRTGFLDEVAIPLPLQATAAAARETQERTGTTFCDVTGF